MVSKWGLISKVLLIKSKSFPFAKILPIYVDILKLSYWVFNFSTLEPWVESNCVSTMANYSSE